MQIGVVQHSDRLLKIDIPIRFLCKVIVLNSNIVSILMLKPIKHQLIAMLMIRIVR